MKKFATLLLFAISGLINPVIANSEITTVNFPIACSNMKALAAVLAEYKEQPAMTMNSVRDAGGAQMVNPLILFINYETKTWTLGERISQDVVCLIAVGDGITPYKPK